MWQKAECFLLKKRLAEGKERKCIHGNVMPKAIREACLHVKSMPPTFREMDICELPETRSTLISQLNCFAVDNRRREQGKPRTCQLVPWAMCHPNLF